MTARAARLVCGASILLAIVMVASPAQRRPARLLRPFRGAAGRRARAAHLPEVLRRVVASATTLCLAGERVVDQRVRGQLVRHEENFLRAGLRTRIWFPPGSPFAGQIIVDNGNSRWRYNPRSKQLNQEPSQRDDVLARLVGPNHNILVPRVALSAGGLVAGINTTLATIRNRQGATVQELYIDPKSGAVLKRVGYNNKGDVVANYEFTHVNFNPSISPADFQPPKSPKPTVTPETVARRLAATANLPPLVIRPGQGFRLFASSLNRRAAVQVLHEVYLGPTAKLSVFIFRAAIDPDRLTRRAGKIINAWSTTVDGATVVLVGPYTQDYLRRLGGELIRP